MYPCFTSSFRYDFVTFLKEALAFLRQHFPGSLSPDPTSPCYVITWLALADDLQLEEVGGWSGWNWIRFMHNLESISRWSDMESSLI